jgi:hypothetical protein
VIEIWRPVIGYEGLYEVSDLGRVRSLDRVIRNGQGEYLKAGKILSQIRTPPMGYLSVTLTNGDRGKRYRVHVLVLEAFMGPRPKKLIGCHNNGDLDDNRPENLRWDTHAANTRDMIGHGRHYELSKTHCLRGHEFTTENTYIRAGTAGRQCRQCVRDRKGVKNPYGPRVMRTAMPQTANS